MYIKSTLHVRVFVARCVLLHQPQQQQKQTQRQNQRQPHRSDWRLTAATAHTKSNQIFIRARVNTQRSQPDDDDNDDTSTSTRTTSTQHVIVVVRSVLLIAYSGSSQIGTRRPNSSIPSYSCWISLLTDKLRCYCGLPIALHGDNTFNCWMGGILGMQIGSISNSTGDQQSSSCTSGTQYRSWSSSRCTQISPTIPKVYDDA